MLWGKNLLLGGALLLGGCAAQNSEIALRVKPLPYAESGPAAYKIAEARGHFALGNVALALQGFRLALREAPESVDALNGLAACYDRMGRFELSRRYYEQALAVAPGDARLYANLSTSLELQGRTAEAARVRADFAARAKGEGPGSVVAAERSAGADLAATQPAAGVSVALAAVEPPAAAAGPSLERVSLAEVTLVTKPRAVWKAQPLAASRTATTIAFSPVKPRVTLLNAARVSGLAARTRDLLEARGWRRIAIGDAPTTAVRSTVAYPAERRAEAVRLANQFNFALRHDPNGEQRLTLILGRDAARALQAPRKS